MTIALVERLWHGHHPTYYKAFCQAALDLGYDVLAVCPFPDQIEVLYTERAEGRLGVIKFNPPRSHGWPRTATKWVDGYLANRWLKKTLRKWESDHRQKITLVFFACIYDGDYSSRTAKGFPWPWSGLYLHCRSFRMPGTSVPQTQVRPRPERLFRNPNLQSLAILDEGAVEYLAGITHRPIIVIPDFTDETAPSPEIAVALRQFAGGRPIVGLLGHLQPSKGIATLARVALDPANRDLVFAFVGELTGAFEEEDRLVLDELKAAPNVFAHFESVPDEASFNGVVQACDVLFAAYHDFPHSSNLMTKAAVFQKPIIVSDGYLMAERARRYRLGEIIPQRDPGLATAALRRILTDKTAWLEKVQPRWEEYRAAHSRESAKQALGRIFAGSR